jgi:hypothetical protein
MIGFKEVFIFFLETRLYFTYSSDSLDSKSYKDTFERKENYIHPDPCNTLPVVLVTNSQNSLLEGDHLPDEGTSKVFSGTKSSTSGIPT